VTANGLKIKSSYVLKANDLILVTIPPPEALNLDPERVPFAVVHEDDSLLVLDKPAGVVVHPSPGHSSGTLVHGLLHHCRDLSGIGGVIRPGIVHRLDKDTSGLMVVAKDDRTHEALARQFKEGRIRKEYVTLVHGGPGGARGRIDLPIGRHPKHRKRMDVVPGGREAVTLWEVEKRYGSLFSRLRINLLTGRTHQIRVHLSHAGFPVAGDPVYGYKRLWWKKQLPEGERLRNLLARQMLHAARLSFSHPGTGAACAFESAIPADMAEVMEMLENTDFLDKIS